MNTSKKLRLTKDIARLINSVINLLKKNPDVIPIPADNDLSPLKKNLKIEILIIL